MGRQLALGSIRFAHSEGIHVQSTEEPGQPNGPGVKVLQSSVTRASVEP